MNPRFGVLFEADHLGKGKAPEFSKPVPVRRTEELFPPAPTYGAAQSFGEGLRVGEEFSAAGGFRAPETGTRDLYLLSLLVHAKVVVVGGGRTPSCDLQRSPTQIKKNQTTHF